MRPWAVKRFNKFFLAVVLPSSHRQNVVALLAFAKHEIPSVERLGSRRDGLGGIAHGLPIQLNSPLRDELSSGTLRGGQSTGQQQIDQRDRGAGTRRQRGRGSAA